jgi:hypothetical protein
MLMNTRKILGASTQFSWQDSQALATNLLEARIRAKFHGGEYIILRPYIYNALRWEHDGKVAPRPPFDLQEWVKKLGQDFNHDELRLPDKEISYETFQNDPKLAELFLWCCKRCIDAAMASTLVFDGVASPLEDKRLRVTNIHGTATA